MDLILSLDLCQLFVDFIYFHKLQYEIFSYTFQLHAV